MFPFYSFGMTISMKSRVLVTFSINTFIATEVTTYMHLNTFFSYSGNANCTAVRRVPAIRLSSNWPKVSYLWRIYLVLQVHFNSRWLALHFRFDNKCCKVHYVVFFICKTKNEVLKDYYSRANYLQISSLIHLCILLKKRKIIIFLYN